MALASSPLSSPPSSSPVPKESHNPQTPRPYRPARELPFELANNINMYIEEALFAQAFTFLLSVTSNSASSLNPHSPVIIPPPPYLSVAATLVVHPLLTTRTNAREKWSQANLALQLLRLIHKTVGPMDAKFSTAFSFSKFDFKSSRHGGRRPDDVFEGDAEQLNTPYAGTESIWGRAEDFWSVVGWAFNCSCIPAPSIHAERWTHYQRYLSFMLDVLETDWTIHSSRNTADSSLICQYIAQAGSGNGSARRILRSIFANGEKTALNEFREIFRGELKEAPKEQDKIKKRQVDVNIEEDIYGDYLAQGSSDFSDHDDNSQTRPQKRLRARGSAARLRNSGINNNNNNNNNNTLPTSTTTTHPLGDPSSIRLRLRLLQLLSNVSHHLTTLPTVTHSFIDPTELYTQFVENIKPLPLHTFTSLILPVPTPTHPLTPTTHTTLSTYILQRLLSTSPPPLATTQHDLESAYLPHAATRHTVDANCRVSVLLEALLRLARAAGSLTRTAALERALEEGIAERTARCMDGRKGRRKGPEGDEEAWACLLESSRRMSAVVQSLNLP